MDVLRNLLIPFKRDRKSDFASGTGEELLRSKARQALMTDGATEYSAGELMWRTSFGSRLTLLRHKRNNEVLLELARVYVRECLRRWVPTAELTNIEIVQIDSKVFMRLSLRERETSVTLDVPVEG